MLLLVTMMTVAAMPAFAAEEPKEAVVDEYGYIVIDDGGNYILSGTQLFNIRCLSISSGTLTIPPKTKATFKSYNNAFITNDGAVYVYGTLSLPKDRGRITGSGRFLVASCSNGRIEGDTAPLPVEYLDHAYVNGVCGGCGKVCAHDNQVDGICHLCGMSLDSLTGSVLSFGYPWIVIAIPVLALGTVAALLIVKKKKKAAALSAAETNTEDSEE